MRPPSPELLGGASRPPPVVLQGASRPPSCIGWWRAPARPPGVTRPQAESVVSFPARLRLAHLTTPGGEGVARHEMAINTAQEDIGLFCWSACRPPQNSSPVGLPASPTTQTQEGGPGGPPRVVLQGAQRPRHESLPRRHWPLLGSRSLRSPPACWAMGNPRTPSLRSG